MTRVQWNKFHGKSVCFDWISCSFLHVPFTTNEWKNLTSYFESLFAFWWLKIWTPGFDAIRNTAVKKPFVSNKELFCAVVKRKYTANACCAGLTRCWHILTVSICRTQSDSAWCFQTEYSKYNNDDHPSNLVKFKGKRLLSVRMNCHSEEYDAFLWLNHWWISS